MGIVIAKAAELDPVTKPAIAEDIITKNAVGKPKLYKFCMASSMTELNSNISL